MLWPVWIGLAIAILAVSEGAYRAITQALGVFRALKQFKSATGQALESLTRSVERLAEHPDAAPKLDPALARLRRDRAYLDVLVAAVDDVRDSVARVTAVYPRK